MVSGSLRLSSVAPFVQRHGSALHSGSPARCELSGTVQGMSSEVVKSDKGGGSIDGYRPNGTGCLPSVSVKCTVQNTGTSSQIRSPVGGDSTGNIQELRSSDLNSNKGFYSDEELLKVQPGLEMTMFQSLSSKKGSKEEGGPASSTPMLCLFEKEGKEVGVSSVKLLGLNSELVVKSVDHVNRAEGAEVIGENGIGIEGSDSDVEEVPSTFLNNSGLLMVVGRGDDSVSCESGELVESGEDLSPVPLSSFNPELEWPCNSSDWVLRKVEEIRDCVGISCEGFEEQFRALLIAIEAGQPALAKSAAKKERELKRLEFSINYKSRDGCGWRDKGKERAVNGL
ncbi:hypothetical protein CIPAW_05G041700 [Carya illinoinensis]|uniref:Uncharacterized protein n=1 Tax=Carya illinoinensis TaxID=32201 RepID=A0A8T1QFG1_CARIL|nr:hypothetical protein CIPAW_05G041700 [Carya illinoinensis]